MAASKLLHYCLDNLKKRLDEFGKTMEWADIVHWLNRLNEDLVQVRVRDFEQKELLAKRLCK